MSLSSANRPPKYCRQREKNRPDRTCVWIDGKKITLGVYDSPESHRRYAELTKEKTDEIPLPAPVEVPTVAVVMVALLEHAKDHYFRPLRSLAVDNTQRFMPRVTPATQRKRQ